MSNPLTGDQIFRAETTTKQGHSLQFFFNRETNLVAVDVIHKNEKGGNEIFRRTIDLEALLKHCR